MLPVYKGDLKDIKHIEPIKVEGGFGILINKEYLDTDTKSYPEKLPYLCDTLETAIDYCNMILEMIDAVDCYETTR